MYQQNPYQMNQGMGGMQTFNQQQPYGYYPMNQQQPQPSPNENVQFLTAEEMQELQKHPQSFQAKLTRDEYLRSICTHKDKNGRFAVEDLKDRPGHCRCSICGAEWNMIDVQAPDGEVDRICSDFYDLFQTIKSYYGNVPMSMKEIYLISGFISKVPQLWKIAKKYFEHSVGGSFGGQNVQNTDQYGFNVLANLFGNPGMATMPGYNPYYQAAQQVPPMGYYQQPQQPMMNQQPMNPQPMMQPQQYAQAPTYGMNPQAVQQNPIGYVDNSNDFTQNGQQQTQTTQQSVAMPGPNVNAGTQTVPTMPDPPQNPNLKTNEKANVGKAFNN